GYLEGASIQLGEAESQVLGIDALLGPVFRLDVRWILKLAQRIKTAADQGNIAAEIQIIPDDLIKEISQFYGVGIRASALKCRKCQPDFLGAAIGTGRNLTLGGQGHRGLDSRAADADEAQDRGGDENGCQDFHLLNVFEIKLHVYIRPRIIAGQWL